MSFNSDMESQKMRFNSFVIKSTVTAASLPDNGIVVTKANLPLGSGVWADMTGSRVSTLPATGYVKFIYNASATRPNIESHPINVGMLTKTKQKYVAPSEQITSIGYDGSNSVTFPFANSTSYGIMMRMEMDDHCFGGNRSWPFSFSGQYKTSTSATSIEAAIKAADALFSHVNEVSSDIMGAKPDVVRITVISNAAATAIAQTASVSNGSKSVTFSAAPSGVVVGDYITIGAVQDIYKVATLTGANATLTTDFRGASGIGLTVGEVAVVPSTSLVGVKLSGIANEFDPILFKSHVQTHFSVSVISDGEGVGAVINTTQPHLGKGTYELVAGEELSSHYRNNLGTLPTFMPNVVPTLFSETGKKYSIVDVKWQDNTDSDTPLGTVGRTFGNLRLFLELDEIDEISNTMAADSLAETILVADYVTGDLDA